MKGIYTGVGATVQTETGKVSETQIRAAGGSRARGGRMRGEKKETVNTGTSKRGCRRWNKRSGGTKSQSKGKPTIGG